MSALVVGKHHVASLVEILRQRVIASCMLKKVVGYYHQSHGRWYLIPYITVERRLIKAEYAFLSHIYPLCGSFCSTVAVAIQAMARLPSVMPNPSLVVAASPTLSMGIFSRWATDARMVSI